MGGRTRLGRKVASLRGWVVWPGAAFSVLDKQRGGPVEAACAVSGGVASCCICDLSATYPRLGGHCYYRPHLL